MKTRIALAGLALLLAAPSFASDRGPQPDAARRSSQVQRAGTAAATSTPPAPMPHDPAAMTGHPSRSGAGTCGCAAMKHDRS